MCIMISPRGVDASPLMHHLHEAHNVIHIAPPSRSLVMLKTVPLALR